MADLRATIQLIKDNTDLRQIIPDLKKSGSAYMRLCPFHSDRDTPSLQVNKEYFYCHSCKTSGDVIGWFEKTQGLDFTSALALAAAEAGVSLDDDTYERLAKSQKERSDREEENYRYQKDLLANEKALAYLYERGLDEETIHHFGLGYRSDWQAISIPIYGRGGQLDSISYRFLDNTERRWYHKNTDTWTKSDNLYNSQCLDFNEGPVYCCEGQFDAFSLWKAGYRKTVAVMGGNLSESHVRELTGQAIVFVPDNKNSEGDFQLFKRSVFRLRYAHPELSIKVALLPEGTDPSSSGEEAIHEAISNCQVAEFAILQHDLDQCAEIDQEYRVARTVCADVKDVLILDDIIRYLSKRWEKERDVVKSALARTDSAKIKVHTIADGIASLEENERKASIDGLGFPWEGISKYAKRPHTKQICVFAGRAGVGKTMFSLNMLHKSRKYEIPTLFASLEQPTSELVHRLAVMTASEMDLLSKRELHNLIVSGGEDWDAIKAVLEFGFPHVRFCDTRLDVVGLGDAVIDASYSMGSATKLLFVDYLGLIKSTNKGSSYERVSETARDLQEMTKERDVYSIVLSQLNREAGDGSQPVQLQNLRESGVVEEVADLVIATWKLPNVDISEDLGLKKMRIEILKHRHGSMGGCDMWLDEKSLILSEAEYYHGSE